MTTTYKGWLIRRLENGTPTTQQISNFFHTHRFINYCVKTGTIVVPRKLWVSATAQVSWSFLKWRRCWAALSRRPPQTRSAHWPLQPLPLRRRLPSPSARPRSSFDACQRILETVSKDKSLIRWLDLNHCQSTQTQQQSGVTAKNFLTFGISLSDIWWERVTSPNAHENSSTVKVNLRQS